jgi:hypothetical protein
MENKDTTENQNILSPQEGYIILMGDRTIERYKEMKLRIFL